MELKLVKLSADHADRRIFERINAEAFPPSERMTMDAIFSFASDTDTDILGIYDGELPVGFAVLLKNKVCGYLYFLVVDRQLRSRGYGSAALKELLNAYAPLQLILDFEEIDPDAANYAQRLRRKRFYLQNGFHETGRYTFLREDRFEVVCSGGVLLDDALIDLLHVLHSHRPEFPDVLV